MYQRYSLSLRIDEKESFKQTEAFWAGKPHSMSRKSSQQDAIYNERGSGAIAHGGHFSGISLKGQYVY